MSRNEKKSEERIQSFDWQLTNEAEHCAVTISSDPSDLPSIHGLLQSVHQGMLSSDVSVRVTSPSQCDDDTNALRLLQALNDKNDGAVDACLSVEDVHHWINNKIELKMLRNPVTSIDPLATTTCIRYAVNHCDAFAVHRLLEAGADVRAVFNCGCKPLTKACRSDVDANAKVKLLLQRDASLIDELDCCGATPLASAVLDNKLDVIKTLIEHGADVEGRYGEDEQTSLSGAALYGKPECVKILLEDFGASVNACDKDGKTPLHDACDGGYVSCIHELMKHGADVEARERKTCPVFTS